MGKFAAAAILGLLVPAFQSPGVSRDRLPVLGTVGDLPPEKETVVVEVLPTPALLVEGKQVDLNGFQAYLQPKADAAREEDAARASKLHVVLRADRDVPWQDMQWVLQACADPRIRVYRILFAAVPEDGGAEGAMALFLPKDVGPQSGSAAPPVRAQLPVRLRVKGDSPGPTGRALYAALAKTMKERAGEFGPASLDADPDVATGSVLESVDALLRWGAKGVHLKGTTPAKPVVRTAGAVARPSIAVLNVPVAPFAEGDPVPPPLARVTGRMAGQAASVVEEPLEEGHSSNPILDEQLHRKRILKDEGGAGTEAAVEAGLEWLKNHQAPAGHWDSDGFEAQCKKKKKCGNTGAPLFDPGLTGLSLLSFQGYGETHKTPRFGSVVRNGLKYLKGIQDAEGCFGPRTSGHFTYNHAISTMAMVENYALTGSPLFHASAQNGVNFIHECRNPYLGWRYGVKPVDNDTSVTGWMVMALHAAKSAGLETDPDAFEGAMNWLGKLTDPRTGRTGYTHVSNGPARPQELLDLFPKGRTESLTALAVLMRFHCGAKADDEFARKGLALCLKVLPRYDEADGSVDFYYWHFGSLALFQAGGDGWRTWNAAMKKALVGSQKKGADDDRRGSWDPMDPWGADGGRIYATALNTLTLETYYRYARFVKAK
jgi:biopolymer transport protein ExbD